MTAGRVGGKRKQDDSELNDNDRKQKKQREDERLREAAFFRLIQGEIELKALNLGKYNPNVEQSQEDGLVPAIGVPLPPRFGLLKDGLYEYKSESGKLFHFWLKDNTAYLTVPVHSEPAYSQAMNALIKVLSGGKGYNTMTFDFNAASDPGYFGRGFNLFSIGIGAIGATINRLTGQPYSARTWNIAPDNFLNKLYGFGKINTRTEEVHKFLDACEKNGTRADLGVNATTWLNGLTENQGLIDKLTDQGSSRLHEIWDRIDKINIAYTEKQMARQVDDPDSPTGKRDLYSLCQNKEFKERRIAINQGVEVTADDGSKGRSKNLTEQFPGAAPTDLMNKFKESITQTVGAGGPEPATGDQMIGRIAAELNQIEARKRAVDGGITELKVHVSGLEGLLQTGSAANPEEVRKVIDGCKAQRDFLIEAIQKEQEDLAKRATAIQAVLTDPNNKDAFDKADQTKLAAIKGTPDAKHPGKHAMEIKLGEGMDIIGTTAKPGLVAKAEALLSSADQAINQRNASAGVRLGP